MVKRSLWIVGTMAAVWIAAVGTGRTWSDAGRRLYVKKAVEALPKPLKGFYELRELTINEAMNDPTKFGPRVVFEVDRLEAFPFVDLPTSRELAVRKYGEETLKEVGDGPWRLIECYDALVEAFKTGDFPTAVSRSAEIAVYVGELYDPPNVSQNGDGEPTGQQGLRERVDSRLMEAFGDKLKLNTPSAIFLDRPPEYAVSIPRKSYVFVDNLLLYDYLSRMGVESYDRFYYDGMWLRAQPVVEQLLSGAALDTASFWYTAWVSARKPELPKQ